MEIKYDPYPRIQNMKYDIKLTSFFLHVHILSYHIQPPFPNTSPLPLVPALSPGQSCSLIL
jgi:hypothetical protein